MSVVPQKSKGQANFLERVPPNNFEAEQSLLGSMLISPEAITAVIEEVRVEDFYRDDHAFIFGAVMNLYARGEPVDPITVAEELKARGVLDKVGGKPYVHTLVNVVPTAANIQYYADIVKKNAVLRSLIKAGTEVVSLGYEPVEDVELIIDKAESIIFGVSQKRVSEGFLHIKELITESFEQIEKLYEKQTHVTGLPSGFTDLDRLTSGFQSSDLIIVAGRPSMGKSAFALNIAEHVGLHEKIPVMIFSLEMSRQQLAQRMLCSEARVDSLSLRTGYLKEEDWPKLSNAAGRLADAPIFIDDTPNITIMEIRAKARRFMAKHRQNLGLVVVDYLQLMQGHGRSENRQQEISEISRALKILGREINVPIIAVSQLSRAVEQRGDKRPLLSDLRESGAIEQDADLVLFIYRDDYYNKDSDSKGIAEIIISKHRNGPTGAVELVFLEHYTKFADYRKG